MTTGIVLAGGRGTRMPLTMDHTNKHLLLVYDREMIRFPVEALSDAGIKDVVVVLGDLGSPIVDVLQDGKYLGLESLSYVHQGAPKGTGHSLLCAEHALHSEDCVVILGDSFFGHPLTAAYEAWCANPHGALLVSTWCDHPENFGRIKVDGRNGNRIVTGIWEKDPDPCPDEVSTGCCFLDNEIWVYLKETSLSPRGELEFPDALQGYIDRSGLRAFLYDGFWTDMGTPAGIFAAAGAMHKATVES